MDHSQSSLSYSDFVEKDGAQKKALDIQIPPEVWCLGNVFWGPNTFLGGVWMYRDVHVTISEILRNGEKLQ